MGQSEDKQRNGDGSISERNSVLTHSKQIFCPNMNAKPDFKRNMLITASMSPNVEMSRNPDKFKDDGEQIAAGQLSSSDANIDMAFDDVDNLRREVSIVSGISMKSIELN